MQNLNNIFLGVTTSPAREFIADVAASRQHSRYLMPCCGTFAVVACMRARGIEAGRIFASDISLFSSIIGYLSDPARRLSDLGIVPSPEVEPFLDGASDDLETGAGLLLAMKYLQLSIRSQYHLNIRREMRSRRQSYRAHILERLKELVEKVAGVHYAVADVRDVFAEAQKDEEAFVSVSLPAYTGGYTKMFEAVEAGLPWKSPDLAEFDPAQAGELMASFTGRPQVILSELFGNLDRMPAGWQAVLAVPQKKGKVNYVVSNHALDNPQAVLSIPKAVPRKLPIYDDEEITPATRVEFVEVDLTTCLYYRDLFVHRLGVGVTTGSLRPYLLLLDGMVAASLALNDVFLMQGKFTDIWESFGVCRTSARYPRIARLYKMLLTSGDMKRVLNLSARYGLRDLRGVQTIAITKHPQCGSHRGIMKLISREEFDDDNFRLVYRADFRDDSFQECIAAWLKKQEASIV